MLNGETANEFDARVERLWRTLDASNKGYLDIAGLKKGLNRMDHRECPVCRWYRVAATDGCITSSQIRRRPSAGSSGHYRHEPRRSNIIYWCAAASPSMRWPCGSLTHTRKEFHDFVRQTEIELWQLFKDIDRNRDGRLDKAELATAFSNSGITVSRAKLDRFFSEVDANSDGSLSFDEWRYSSTLTTQHTCISVSFSQIQTHVPSTTYKQADGI